jgi:hypothetical protein
MAPTAGVDAPAAAVVVTAILGRAVWVWSTMPCSRQIGGAARSQLEDVVVLLSVEVRASLTMRSLPDLL